VQYSSTKSFVKIISLFLLSFASLASLAVRFLIYIFHNSNRIAIGEPNTPLKGTLDPEILIWCEAHKFVMITNNRTSMPVHLVEHINIGHHVPGIFILNPDMGIGETIEELILVAEASFEEEYQDQIINLPILGMRS
jgi:hypothetical protein